MIPKLDNYFEQIRNAFFLAHTVGGHTFESLSKEVGLGVYNLEAIYACLKTLEELILDRRGDELPDRKLILEKVFDDIERLSTEIESHRIGAQLDFCDGDLTAYDYLYKVNQQFLTFRWNFIKLCQKYGLSTPGVPTDKLDPAFPDFFKNKEVPELCKNIFGKVESPKIYAIMFSLLEKNRLLSIAPNRRPTYFKAWYKYINKAEPTSGKWSAISDYFKGQGTQIFAKEKDPAYVMYKDLFEQELKGVLIIS